MPVIRLYSYGLRSVGLLASLLLTACVSMDARYGSPVSNVYCDSFLSYDMCARDIDRDGVVDFVYFADGSDIFMYREGSESRFPAEYGVHRCAQVMDESLVNTASRLFYIDDETGFLEKQNIRGAMMIKYIGYMPRVSACNRRAEEEDEKNALRAELAEES